MLSSTLLLHILALVASSAMAIPNVTLTLKTPSNWTEKGPNTLSYSILSDSPTAYDILLLNPSKQFFGGATHSLALALGQTADDLTGVQREVVVFPYANRTEVGSYAPDVLSWGGGYQVRLVAHGQNTTSAASAVTSTSETFNITASTPTESTSAQTSTSVDASRRKGAGASVLSSPVAAVVGLVLAASSLVVLV